MSDNQPDPREAGDMLNAARAASSRSAGKLVTPWWYEPVLALALAGMMLAPVAPSPFNALLAVVCLVPIVLVLHHYRAQPVWVNGWRRGRTLYASVGFFAFFLLLYAGSLYAFHVLGLVWAPIVSAIAIFVGFILFNRIWMALWRSETRPSTGPSTGQD